MEGNLSGGPQRLSDVSVRKAEEVAEVPVLSLLAVIHTSVCGERSAGLCRRGVQAALMQENSVRRKIGG